MKREERATVEEFLKQDAPTRDFREEPETRQAQERGSFSLWQFVRYFLKLGLVGFGGPVALVGYMRRDLVESRQWVSEADYQEGLALAQLSPGPLAAQLAMYLGYVR